MNTTEFDEIRPYNDDELPQIFEELINLIRHFKLLVVPFQMCLLKYWHRRCDACKMKLDFQKTFCYEYIYGEM